MHYFSGAFLIARKRVCAAGLIKLFKVFRGVSRVFDNTLDDFNALRAYPKKVLNGRCKRKEVLPYNEKKGCII